MEIKDLAKESWTLRKKVLPQHADHAGVMWHGAYLTWMEEARVEALHKVGLAYRDLSEQGYEMPVVSLQINYLSPLIHGDEVVIKSWLLPRKGPRWPWKTIFLRNGVDQTASAVVDLVLIRREGKSMRVLRSIPEQISIALKEIQKGP